MNARERELLDRVASHVLRRPDYPPEPEAERLLTRLNAARRDVDRILLERVVVLEAALDAVREQAAREREQAAVARAREPVAAPAGAGVGRLLREAAVVAAGVAGGALLVRGVDAAASELAGLFGGEDASVAGDEVADPGVDWA
jgi:hypothetical protein